jgi:hypothetical protein
LPKYKTRHQRVALLFPRYIFAGPVEQWPAPIRKSKNK